MRLALQACSVLEHWHHSDVLILYSDIRGANAGASQLPPDHLLTTFSERNMHDAGLPHPPIVTMMFLQKRGCECVSVGF